MVRSLGCCEERGEGEERNGGAVSPSADCRDQVYKDFGGEVKFRQHKAQPISQLQGQCCHSENRHISPFHSVYIKMVKWVT